MLKNDHQICAGIPAADSPVRKDGNDFYWGLCSRKCA